MIPGNDIITQDTWYGGYLIEKNLSNNYHGKIFNVLKQVSVPECQDLLSPVFALLEARTQHYSQVTNTPWC